LTTTGVRTHLFHLDPGATFRVGVLGQFSGPIYRVVAGKTPDHHAFLDERGEPISPRALAMLNQGDFFVHVLNREIITS
jgi:hypothetical protein